MMHAYDEQYLDDAMRNLGEAADYAVNACGISLQKFFYCNFSLIFYVIAKIGNSKSALTKHTPYGILAGKNRTFL